MTISLFVKTIKVERRILRLMNKSTANHTVAKTILFMKYAELNNKKSTLYECLSDSDFNTLFKWMSKKYLKEFNFTIDNI